MGKKSKTPPTPDYSAIAGQQQKLGQQAWGANLQANRVSQNNPMGSTSWEQDPTTGKWTQNTSFNAPQQKIFEQQQANQQQIADLSSGLIGNVGSNKIDFSGAPKMPEVGGYNQQVIDTINKLNAPGLQQARAAKEAQLAAMGLGTASGQAWNNEQRNLSDAEDRARMQATLAGIQQGNTAFGQGMQLHQQGIEDITGQEKANMQKMAGLMGVGQQMGIPQFNDYYTSQPYQVADLTGAAQNKYQADLNTTNAKNADKAATGSTIATGVGMAAAAAAMMF